MRVVILILATAINVDLSSSTSLASIVLAPFVILGWLAMATLWVAMWYFWLSFDKSSWGKKLAWFVVLMLPPVGTLAYFFAIYYRAEYFRRRRYLEEYEKIDPAEEKAFTELPGREY